MPSCMTASHVAHPSPAVPTIASASTRTPSKSTRYCVSDEIVMQLGEGDAVGGGSTRNSDRTVIGAGQHEEAVGRSARTARGA